MAYCRLRLFYTLLLLFFLSFQSFSQGEMLTKGETISYIDKVVKRAIGHSPVWIMSSDDARAEITSAGFSASGENVSYTYRTKDYNDGYCRASGSYTTYTFHPAHIKNITMKKINKSSVVYVIVKMRAKDMVTIQSDSRKYFSDEMSFYLFMPETKNFDSFKKALLHLKDLASAEDDPFGE